MIGAGDMSRYHLSAWQRVPGARVVAISNRTAARAEERARQFGIPTVYDDPVRMLDAERIDAVDIVTDRHSHVSLVRLAADRGIDVMCQKPLAPTLGEAEALVSDIGGRVRLMVHENRRFAPYVRQIRAWIDAGRVGSPRHATMTTYRVSLLRQADGTRPAVERAAYFATEPRLAIGEVLIHQLDVLRFLLGPLRVLAARTLRTEPDIAGESLAGIMLETDAGAPVQLLGSLVAVGIGQPGESESPLGAQASDRLEITGSEASVVMEGTTLTLLGPHPESITVDPAASYQACFDAAIHHFVSRLRDGAPFETDAADNLETLRLVEDAYLLAEQGSAHHPVDRP
jgi:D-apiose dehydrogenase